MRIEGFFIGFFLGGGNQGQTITDSRLRESIKGYFIMNRLHPILRKRRQIREASDSCSIWKLREKNRGKFQNNYE